MGATVTDLRSARPNRPHVRRVQPDPRGGRPVDPLMEGFEGTFQGLIVCKDDEQLDGDWIETLRFVAAREQTLVRHIFAGRSPKELEREIRACRRITEKLINLIEKRQRRLDVIRRDQQSMTTALCQELDDRSHFRSPVQGRR